MSKPSAMTHSPPTEVEDAVRRLGRNIRIARLRRRLRIEDIADAIGASRFTVSGVEKGKISASMAAYAGSLWALGLLDQMERVADPDLDDTGKVLESARQPTRARRRMTLDNDF